MSAPVRNFTAGGYHHIYNRGNHKQPIFIDDTDRIFFLEKITENCTKYKSCIAAYCLMDNHYHFIIRQNGIEAISKIMQATMVSYVKRFNKKYGLVGHLFQDRFKSIAILTDEYLINLTKYIHLNPAEFTDYEAYSWSSYKAYITSEPTRYCDPTPVLKIFNELYGVSYGEFVRSTQLAISEIAHL